MKFSLRQEKFEWDISKLILRKLQTSDEVIRASPYSEHIRVFRSGIVELIGYDQFTSSQPKENIQYGKLYG